MKKLLFVALVCGISIAVMKYTNAPVVPPEVAARAGDKLVMYTTTHCPYCAEARVWLTRNGITFRECNTDTSPACSAELDRLGAGGVPTLVYGETIMVGWDPDRLQAVLNGI